MSGETGRDRRDWWLHEVSETEDGTRIDRYLRRLVTGLTQGPIEKMLRIRHKGDRHNFAVNGDFLHILDAATMSGNQIIKWHS